MGLNIAGLGAFAGGATRGLQAGQDMAAQQQRMGLLDAAEQRLRKQDARLDALDADNAAARDAGVMVIKQAQSDFEKQWKNAGKEQAGPTMDGGLVPTNAKPMFVPDDKVRLKALQASTDELFRRGRLDEAAKAWSVAEAKRAQMRGAAAQNVLSAMQMGADVKPALTEYYDTVDNGFDLADVQTVQGPDGKPAFALSLKNRKTGEVSPPAPVSAEQMQQDILRSVTDPATFAKQVLEQKLVEAKRQAEIAVVQERGKEARLTNQEEAAQRKELEGVKYKNDLGLVGARAAGDLRVKTTAGSGDVAGERQVLNTQLRAAEAEVNKIRSTITAIRTEMAKAGAGTPEHAELKKVLADEQKALEQAKADQRALDGSANAYRGRKSGGLSDTERPAQAAIPMPKVKSELVKDKLYNTPRGPAVWNGTAFEAR